MSRIAVFHSVLGVRQGITDAAELLRAQGHEVVLVDQYDGRTFDDYDEAHEFAQSIGFATLMSLALDGVAELPDGFIGVGFSNGGGMAEFVASKRPVRGVVLLSGALDLSVLGVDAWPCGVPAQVHYAADDPFRNQSWVDAVCGQVRTAGGSVTTFDYPGAGHLFTDPSLPAEYDPAATELLWSRVLPFCVEPPT